MAAAKSRPARGKQAFGVSRGRMPVKRRINLVLTKENKINPFTAALGVILVLALAAAFGKFLVYDRINEATRATARVEQLRTDLDNAYALSKSFGDVEDTYAHYTVAGMTADELGQVDRVQILELIRQILFANARLSTSDFCASFGGVGDALSGIRSAEPTLADLGAFLKESFSSLVTLRQPSSGEATTWSLSENVLTVNVTGRSLETMNDVTRLLEQNPIVDTSIITTANKSDRVELEDRVSARFVVYLKKAEEVSAP